MKYNIGENLKFIRELRGITRDKMASLLHMSGASYTALETEQRSATSDDLAQIAKLTRLSMEDLIYEDLRSCLQFEMLVACTSMTPDIFIREYNKLSETGKIHIARQIDSALSREKKLRCHYE